ncbi:MAG: bifunctional oligoribonuclease/PAP phosphatase NrnA [Clostridia bacterium]|nr:bifunctional oligoribonuclease/PAP phosphatase NrnA [Clostridia bacterium]
MSRRVTVEKAAEILTTVDNIVILTHQFPDGDTLGSAFALCRALQTFGKKVRVLCHDVIPEKYEYMTAAVPQPEFEPLFVCAVDVADSKLLGESLQKYTDKVELCIDHHGSHREFEKQLLLNADMGATAMLIYQVITAMGVTVDAVMADCLYTGIATDTGCFKYSNTTPLTHRMAAELMEAGANAETINRAMFDIKSRARVSLEQMALQSIAFYDNGRSAFMQITEEMIQASGANENDMEGLSPLPRQIEGVWVGVMLRQKADGDYKISVRTGTHADASAICGLLGGGGHPRAAGCTLSGTAEQVIATVQKAIHQAVPRIVDR